MKFIVMRLLSAQMICITEYLVFRRKEDARGIEKYYRRISINNILVNHLVLWQI